MFALFLLPGVVFILPQITLFHPFLWLHYSPLYIHASFSSYDRNSSSALTLVPGDRLNLCRQCLFARLMMLSFNVCQVNGVTG